MSKIHTQSYLETDTEISFDMKVMDDTLRHDYGWQHVVIAKPLTPGKIRVAINDAETAILNDLDDENTEKFIVEYIQQKNRNDT